MKTYLITIIILVFSITLSGQKVLTLSEAKKMAIKTSKEVKIKNAEINKAKLLSNEMKTNFLPNLSASATSFFTDEVYKYSIQTPDAYLPTFTPDLQTGQMTPNVIIDPSTGQPVIGADGNPVFSQYAYMPQNSMDINLDFRTVAYGAINLEQPIYMGGKINSAYNMSKIGVEAANNKKQLTESEVLYQTENAYWQYVSLTEKYKLAQQYEKLLASLSKTLYDTYETGMKTKNDYLKAKVQHNEAILNVQRAKNGVELSRMNLCRIIGIDYSSPINISNNILLDSLYVVDYKSESIQNRPEYHLLKNQIDVKQQNINLTRSEFLPNIYASVGYGYTYRLKINNETLNNGSLSAMVGLKIPIFHWGEGKSKVQQAEIAKDVAVYELENASELMQLEISKSVFNVQEAETRLKLNATSVEQAAENLKISKDNYELGMETLVNLLEAHTQSQRSDNDYIDAQIAYKISIAGYKKATGQLVE